MSLMLMVVEEESVVEANRLLSVVVETFVLRKESLEVLPVTVNAQPPVKVPAVVMEVAQLWVEKRGVPEDASVRKMESQVTVDRALPEK